MLNYIARYVAVLAILVIGDALWLSYFAKAIFRPTLGSVLLDDPRWLFAALFYLLYTAALLIFPVAAGLRNGSWNSAFLYGAMFGFFAYMTYDLTNLATIKAWTPDLALIDMAWGSALTAIASTVGYITALQR